MLQKQLHAFGITNYRMTDMGITRKEAGERQESNVAFQLKRCLDSKLFTVFNNVKISHQGENAQMDHLILHKYGFIVIESKSIFGEVNVNEYGEWSRSYQGKWQGMPSPIKQAELQIAILKGLLAEHAPELLGTLLGKQKGFGGRRYDLQCAISSQTIFHRDSCPDEINGLVVKTEFVGDAIKAIYKPMSGLLSGLPSFTSTELESIKSFFRRFEQGEAANQAVAEINDPNPSPEELPINVAAQPMIEVVISCKACGSTSLKAAYGKYGYYVTCACGKSTSMKGPCPKCSAKTTKVQKKGDLYFRNCDSCGEGTLIGEYHQAE